MIPTVSETSAKTTAGTSTQRQPRCADAAGAGVAGAAGTLTPLSKRTWDRIATPPLCRAS